MCGGGSFADDLNSCLALTSASALLILSARPEHADFADPRLVERIKRQPDQIPNVKRTIPRSPIPPPRLALHILESPKSLFSRSRLTHLTEPHQICAPSRTYTNTLTSPLQKYGEATRLVRTRHAFFRCLAHCRSLLLRRP
jgi:hypothetical protein